MCLEKPKKVVRRALREKDVLSFYRRFCVRVTNKGSLQWRKTPEAKLPYWGITLLLIFLLFAKVYSSNFDTAYQEN